MWREGLRRMKTVPISDIIVRDDVCRDTNRNWDFVLEYARDIILWRHFGGSPPAVEINQRGELVRGWHQLMAYRMVHATEVPVMVVES